jgi:energy-coupling factor transport system permease protein
MESRGYGRGVHRTRRSTRLAGLLTLVGVGGVVVGLYGLLDGTSPLFLGVPTLLFGVACAVTALLVGARRDARTHYRRDRWALPEWLVAASGTIPALVMIVASSRQWDGVLPRQVPAELPAVPLLLVVAIAVGAAAALFAPVPPLLAARTATARNADVERELVAS